MQITFTGHQIEVSDTLKSFAQSKLARLERHYDRITSIDVIFAVEKVNQIAEATVHIPRKTLHAKAESTKDMYAAIDGLVDKLDRQLKKAKEKMEGK